MEQQAMKKSADSPVSTSKELQILECDNGRKLTFDNIDYHHEVHYMTEENQNIDRHFVTVMSTENRVSANHLSDEVPTNGVLQMANGKCLPDARDNAMQRENYIFLVAQIITANIPCLEFLSSVTVQHIPHTYQKEMKGKTDTVSKTILLERIAQVVVHIFFLNCVDK